MVQFSYPRFFINLSICSQSGVEMFEDSNPAMIAIHPVFYLKGNNYLMESLTLIKYPSKFNAVLQQMIFRTSHEDFPVNENLKALIFNFIIAIKLIFIF